MADGSRSGEVGDGPAEAPLRARGATLRHRLWSLLGDGPRPRLATILLLVNVAIVALPLGSIFFLRIYENQLIQETERELIAQAAMIGAAYERELEAMPGFNATVFESWRQAQGRALGRTQRLRGPFSLGDMAEESALLSAPPPPLELEPGDPNYRPQDPQIDLFRDPTLPSRPDGVSAGAANPFAAEVGQALTPFMARAQETTLAGMRLLDPEGVVVGGQAEIGLSFAHVPEVREALAGRYASALRYRELEGAPPELASISRGTGVRVFVAYPVLRDDEVWGVAYLSRTPKSALKHMYEERDKVVIAALLILGVAAGLAMLTSRTISRPVAALTERMRAIMGGDRAAMAPLARPGTREIAELSEGISRMAGALEARAETVRAFARHVSHEFKTPIAGIRGAAEILEDHAATLTEAERERFAGNILRDAGRLEALLARLLDLARAEHAAPPPGPLALNEALPEAARRAGQRLGERAGASGLSVEASVPKGLAARITEEALGILVDNLARNAAEHGATQLRIVARQGASGGDGARSSVHLAFSDNGRGISPANRARVFEQFFTTRRADGGTGLGLSIVRAVLASQGGAIALGSADGEAGAVFEITLRG
ncbi:MAG: HAMP domain-containing sensor histidine kinase [Pseudomonadota bacterium]